MTQQLAVWFVLVLAVLAANLPFFTERLLLVGPRCAPKAFAWRLLELLLLCAVVLGLGTALEANIGQRAPQEWQFFRSVWLSIYYLGVSWFCVALPAPQLWR